MRKKLFFISIGGLAVIGILMAASAKFAFRKPVSPAAIIDAGASGISSTTKRNFPGEVSLRGLAAAKALPNVTVSVSAGSSSYAIEVPKGTTAYDAMTTLASENSSFTFKSKLYSGLGYFIQEINGVPNAGGKYWTLYLNGKYSNVGASQYVLQQGDNVEWRFENNNQ